MKTTRGSGEALTASLDPLTYWDVFPSPIGDLRLVGDGENLVGLFMDGHSGQAAVGAHRAGATRDPAPFREVHAQLRAYFAGRLRQFELPVRMVGTEFQLMAWDALRKIPFGETRTYGDQASRIGRPKAVRAVGAANGRNPVSIVVPCHRVIGRDGSLTGFGGGIDRKRWLLRHEGVHVPDEETGMQVPLF